MAKGDIVPCKHCGREFKQSHGNEQYCNRKECKEASRNPYKKKVFKCPHCGGKFKLEDLY